MEIVGYIIVGIVALSLWVGAANLVNQEVEKLQFVDIDPEESPFRHDLHVPNWATLRTLAKSKTWVIAALILSPVLVVVWGASILLAFIVLYIPICLVELVGDFSFTLKQANKRRSSD